jgi:hypothetical protein
MKKKSNDKAKRVKPPAKAKAKAKVKGAATNTKCNGVHITADDRECAVYELFKVLHEKDKSLDYESRIFNAYYPCPLTYQDRIRQQILHPHQPIVGDESAAHVKMFFQKNQLESTERYKNRTIADVDKHVKNILFEDKDEKKKDVEVGIYCDKCEQYTV